MDNPFYNNEVVNNLFGAEPNYSEIMQPAPKKFTTIYTRKDVVSTYYNIKCNREDFVIPINETLCEQDIDDYINSELQEKCVLQTNNYYKEVIAHIVKKDNIDNYIDFFYNKPLASLLLCIDNDVDDVINNYKNLISEEMISYSRIQSENFSINYSWLFNHSLEHTLDYYYTACSQLKHVVNTEYYIGLYVYINTCKIEELLKYESTEVKNALKLCYEDRA